MGAVFRPKDLPGGWRKRVHESIKDFSPDIKDGVPEIMDSLEDKRSEELLGHDNAESLTKKTTRREVQSE
jgi:hypothetical protein